MKTSLTLLGNLSRTRNHGMTLVEVLIASGIGAIVLGVIAVLIVFSARSFAALANYQALDQASANTADRMSRELREADGVGNFENKGNLRYVVFSNSIATPPYTIRYEWSATTRELTMKRSLDANAEVLLTDCDRWDFTFYQRSPLPAPQYGFSPNMANQAECKLVTMSWKCSRPIFSTELFNTESVQTAQIVLRNQKTP